MTSATDTTLAWDAAEYLKTELDEAEYLAAASETGDLEDVRHALAIIARSHGTSQIGST